VLQGRDEDAGRQARCPSCGNVLTLTATEKEAEELPPRSTARPADDDQAEKLPLKMNEPRSSAPESKSSSKSGKRYRCRVCDDSFSVDEVYEDGDDYICKSCHEREPPSRSSRSSRSSYRSSRRRYEDDDDDDYYDRRRRRRRREYVESNLVWAILVTLFCCWPAGIVAIVYAAQVDGLVARGDIAEARQAASNAATWCWIAFGGTFIVGFLWFFVVAAGGR